MLPTPPSPPPKHQVAFLSTRFFICRILPPPRHAPPKQIQAQGRECWGEGGAQSPALGWQRRGGQEDFLRNKLVMGHWGVLSWWLDGGWGWQ